jgi:hypothetical protein
MELACWKEELSAITGRLTEHAKRIEQVKGILKPRLWVPSNDILTRCLVAKTRGKLGR